MATATRTRTPRANPTPNPTPTPDTGNNDIRQWEADRENHEPGMTVVPDEDEGSKVVEIAPKPSSPSVVDRARGFVKRSAKKPASKPGPRVSVDKIVGWAWRTVAQMTAPINLPVARVLDAQAPVAGLVLEGVIKDTVVDRVLQPIAKLGQGGEIAFAILGPPLLVGALTARPAMQPVLVPMLRESLRMWIDIAGPALEKVQKQEEEFEKQYGTRIDEMIAYFLSPAPGQVDDAATPE